MNKEETGASISVGSGGGGKWDGRGGNVCDSLSLSYIVTMLSELHLLRGDSITFMKNKDNVSTFREVTIIFKFTTLLNVGQFLKERMSFHRV